ncbi:MAG: DNA-protecting protein DprA [Gemmatimonadetes bacterium]|nr:DNA-protecting protein DprA [Gemmatimonadota bacterium]
MPQPLPTFPIPSPTSSTPPTTNDLAERHAYLALALLEQLGPHRLAALLSHFGSAQAVLSASSSQLHRVAGIPSAVIASIRATDAAAVPAILDEAAQAGQSLLIPPSPDFPAALRSIPDPRCCSGHAVSCSFLEAPAVAIVGSRDHSRYGEEIARELAIVAARAGIAVVSGMARGLDAVAHQGALDVGGPTIGVLGCGVDVMYPRQNAELFRRMYLGGVLLSEHPPGGRPDSPGAFPRRNRLISGLAQVTVVVEAADGSGTMLTVNSALEQGREVLVVPGPVNSPTSRGTNRLVRDGATPLLEPKDLLRLFGATASAATPTSAAAHVVPPCTLSPTEARVFDALGPVGMHVDELALAIGLPVGELLATLLGLEIGGLAQSLPGAQYRRAARA